MNEKITSTSNPRIKKYLKLKMSKYREKFQLFVAEGKHLIDEAKLHGEIVEILTTKEIFEGTLISEAIMKKLCSTETIQPIIAICKMPNLDKLDSKTLGDKVIALDMVQDPGNVGSIIRTARALGFTGVLVKGCDAYNSKAVRASQGAVFNITVIQTKHLSDYFDNREIIGAVVNEKGAKIFNKFLPAESFMLIMGSEGSGITNQNMDYLDERVYIPIQFESLNVAAAAAILMNQYK